MTAFLYTIGKTDNHAGNRHKYALDSKRPTIVTRMLDSGVRKEIMLIK